MAKKVLKKTDNKISSNSKSSKKFSNESSNESSKANSKTSFNKIPKSSEASKNSKIVSKTVGASGKSSKSKVSSLVGPPVSSLKDKIKSRSQLEKAADTVKSAFKKIESKIVNAVKKNNLGKLAEKATKPSSIPASSKKNKIAIKETSVAISKVTSTAASISESDTSDRSDIDEQSEIITRNATKEIVPMKATKNSKTFKASEISKRVKSKLDVEQNAKWSDLFEKFKSVKAPLYNMREVYEAQQPIQHKVLGWGWILSNENDRLEILFNDGKKILISNYKS